MPRMVPFLYKKYSYLRKMTKQSKWQKTEFYQNMVTMSWTYPLKLKNYIALIQTYVDTNIQG
jgi:hypothetical protein